MMNISNVDYRSLLPEFMRDDETATTLSKTLSPLLQNLEKKIPLLSIWNKIDDLPEENLDELAWELNITWYDYNADIETKRELIKSSNLIHSRKGTPWAVKELLKIYFGNAELTEWFEYDGDPYYFRISMEEETLEGIDLKKFYLALEDTKNVRSWLEYILLIENRTVNIYAGAGVHEISDETYDFITKIKDLEVVHNTFAITALLESTIETYNVKE